MGAPVRRISRRAPCRGRVSVTLLGAAAGLFAAVFFVLIFLPWRPVGELPPVAVQPVHRVDPRLDRCAACHRRVTPGIVEQWAESTHARRGVTCRDCHQVAEASPYAQAHVGTHISTTVTPRVCGQCHARVTEEFSQSRHSLPAWASLTGTRDFARDPRLMALWSETSHPPPDPGLVLSSRIALHDLEGPGVTPLACESCHEIGRPNLDGSAGSCSKCHLRHRFNLEQVRRPETCTLCHAGPDQPQAEIFAQSPHGVIYATQEHLYHFSQVTGRLGVDDFPAPTCQICHLSGFGGQQTTHDVGERLSWYLQMPIARHRPEHEAGRAAMREVCRQCHSTDFIGRQFDAADQVVAWTNARIEEANAILAGLIRERIIPPDDFSDPLHHLAFNLWHYGGRAARFGAFMQGPAFTQWSGLYPLMRDLDNLRRGASEARRRAEQVSAEAAAGG